MQRRPGCLISDTVYISMWVCTQIQFGPLQLNAPATARGTYIKVPHAGILIHCNNLTKSQQKVSSKTQQKVLSERLNDSR